jgi:hypothetical protein
LPHTPSSHVLLMPNSKHLTHGISNLVSLITKTKLGLSPAEAGDALDAHGSERPDQQRGAHATGRREERAMQARRV